MCPIAIPNSKVLNSHVTLQASSDWDELMLPMPVTCPPLKNKEIIKMLKKCNFDDLIVF